MYGAAHETEQGVTPESPPADRPKRHFVLVAIGGGLYCGIAGIVFTFAAADAAYGDQASGLWFLVALVVGGVMAIAGVVLALLCLGFDLYRLGPAGPAAIAAVLAAVATPLAGARDGSIGLMILALVMGVVGHAGFIAFPLLLKERWPINWARDVALLTGVVVLALGWAWMTQQEQIDADQAAAARADEIAAEAGYGNLAPIREQPIRLVRGCSDDDVRTQYSYRHVPSGEADLFAQAEDVAVRYEEAGFEIQRFVNPGPTYVIYGVQDGAGVKVLINDDVSIEVPIDCGLPFSLDRGDWRDNRVDTFPR